MRILNGFGRGVGIEWVCLHVHETGDVWCDLEGELDHLRVEDGGVSLDSEYGLWFRIVLFTDRYIDRQLFDGNFFELREQFLGLGDGIPQQLFVMGFLQLEVCYGL